MDPRRFDALAKRLGQPSSRRSVTAGMEGFAAAALMWPDRAHAQEATPPATPSGSGGTTGMAANNATLFVQTAASGSFHPNQGATPAAGPSGAYTLTLHGHTGETIAFSDRPQRNFGEVKTTQFFTSMGFKAVNPPNAALVADSSQQEDDVLLIELMNPA